MTTGESPSEAAARFKAEGNALFSSQKYDPARAKYTEAIELDPNNSILFANRAACHLNLKQ
jgi:tetratricopeptide (TPR) repeat protein